MKEVIKVQVAGLIDGGVDGILLETIFDGLTAKAALLATEEVFEEKCKITNFNFSYCK